MEEFLEPLAGIKVGPEAIDYLKGQLQVIDQSLVSEPFMGRLFRWGGPSIGCFLAFEHGGTSLRLLYALSRTAIVSGIERPAGYTEAIVLTEAEFMQGFSEVAPATADLGNGPLIRQFNSRGRMWWIINRNMAGKHRPHRDNRSSLKAAILRASAST